jgi:hypothetical protein
LFCWVFTAIYAMAFSSFSNFGLLVRQRSLVLPALYVLVAVDPRRARLMPADEERVGGQPQPDTTVVSRAVT